MSYLANKRMNLAGTVYERGTIIPTDVIEDIQPLRLESLKRTRLIVETEAPAAPAGDMCPHCGDGPFQRLAQHVSLKHEDILDNEDLPEEVEDSISPTEEEE